MAEKSAASDHVSSQDQSLQEYITEFDLFLTPSLAHIITFFTTIYLWAKSDLCFVYCIMNQIFNKIVSIISSIMA